jgi:hypothetical protein
MIAATRSRPWPPKLPRATPVAPSTISRWLAEHPALTTYRRLRARGRRLFTPTQVIRTQKLYHTQVYEFSYHRAKLAFLRDGTLDDKRASRATSTARFAAVADFLESIAATCPHYLFRRDDGARSSQLDATFIDPARLVVIEKQNAATEMASLILPSVGTNYERHPKLQRFMLANDSTTIAVEVPIWLTADDIAALNAQHDIRLPSTEAGSITGHIDFIQVRNGAIHILDYKPDARTNKPIAQLTIYALALTRRVPGLKLFDINLAQRREPLPPHAHHRRAEIRQVQFHDSRSAAGHPQRRLRGCARPPRQPQGQCLQQDGAVALHNRRC